MGKTIIEKIIHQHSDEAVKAGAPARAGDIVWLSLDARTARDFGGANVVKNYRQHYGDAPVDDPAKTFFTFDLVVPAKNIPYAINQQICRDWAKEQRVKVFDVDMGIGSHVAIEYGLCWPGSTFVGTDSHLNILGAIGAFGQGMGDQDIAFAYRTGKTWFEVPRTIKMTIQGELKAPNTAKDLTLACLRQLGASGALGQAVEFYGPAVEALGLAGRITLASMMTEMGGIVGLIPPSEEVLAFCRERTGRSDIEAIQADPDAEYTQEIVVDITGLEPLIACPPKPDNVKTVREVAGTKVDSVFIGSCTNGRFEDFEAVARIVEGKHIAPGMVASAVPASREVYRRMLVSGVLQTLFDAGFIVSNPGCGGCASGHIGMVGRGQVQVSTSNRNFAGKQGPGDNYLASPVVAAWAALTGELVVGKLGGGRMKKTKIEGRVWVLTTPGGELYDDIDTDMIFHNRYLHITDLAEMGQYALDNLQGWEDFAQKAQPGDILLAGVNFGAGSSRQQAVDCFRALGIGAIVAESYGAIYKRNAINSGLPIVVLPGLTEGYRQFKNGDELKVDFATGKVLLNGEQTFQAEPFSQVQMDIYRAGDLFAYGKTLGQK